MRPNVSPPFGELTVAGNSTLELKHQLVLEVGSIDVRESSFRFADHRGARGVDGTSGGTGMRCAACGDGEDEAGNEILLCDGLGACARAAAVPGASLP